MQSTGEHIDLGPLYEPRPVAFHFETPGWYLVFGVGLLLILWLSAVLVLKYRRNAYRRQALKLLITIENRFHSSQEVACVNDTMILLKQVALTTYPRAAVAELSGELWLQFLDSKVEKASFTPISDTLFLALYQNKIDQPEQVVQVFNNARNWIKHHA